MGETVAADHDVRDDRAAAVTTESAAAPSCALESFQMEAGHPPNTVRLCDFMLGACLVQPHLNRLSRGEEVVQLEPKLMDVLTFLAARAGRVVSKDELIEGVWKVEFISEWAITRAVARLRRALGDDARHPLFIETISKRGYRLIAPVEPLAETAETGRALEAAARPPAPATPEKPYAPGQWVRGSGFYGREAQIAEILGGNREAMWLLGTRMIGKTSLLKQLEHLTADDPSSGYFPLFWDLQGALGTDELHAHFHDALLESGERLARVGVGLRDVDGGELFASLSQLRRRLRARNLKLLLLCDEVEELIGLQSHEPALLRKLRHALQSQEGIRSVLAAGNRLWTLAARTEATSPFLHGFTPPVYLPPLSDDEARALIRQGRLATGTRPDLEAETVELIARRCGNHPHLIQLLCTRTLGLRNLDAAIAEVTADPAVTLLFAADFEMLTEEEKAALGLVAAGLDERAGEGVEMTEPALASPLHTLDRLGLIEHVGGRRFSIPNTFLLRWLRSRTRP